MKFSQEEERYFKAIAYAAKLLAGLKDKPGDHAKTAAHAYGVTSLDQALKKKRKPSAPKEVAHD